MVLILCYIFIDIVNYKNKLVICQTCHFAKLSESLLNISDFREISSANFVIAEVQTTLRTRVRCPPSILYLF